MAVAGVAWQRRHRRCNLCRCLCRCCISIRLAARAVLVCCAGKGLQESHLHPRSHSHSSSSDFKDDAFQQGVIGCTLKHGRFWKSFHPSSLTQVVFSIRDRACGKSRVHGGAATWPSLAAVAVCGPAACRNAISRRAWGARPGRGLTCHWHSRTGKLFQRRFRRYLPFVGPMSGAMTNECLSVGSHCDQRGVPPPLLLRAF